MAGTPGTLLLCKSNFTIYSTAGPGQGGLDPISYSPDFRTDPDNPAQQDNLEQCVAGIQGRGRGRGTKKMKKMENESDISKLFNWQICFII